MTEKEEVERKEEMEGRGTPGGPPLTHCPLAILAHTLLKERRTLSLQLHPLLSLLLDSHVGPSLHAWPHQP